MSLSRKLDIALLILWPLCLLLNIAVHAFWWSVVAALFTGYYVGKALYE